MCINIAVTSNDKALKKRIDALAASFAWGVSKRLTIS